MELTQEDKAVLAHVVVDPGVWVEHALKTVGESAVLAKIERWKPDYLTKKDLPDYKNRAERDAAEIASKPIPTYADLRRAAYPPGVDYLDGIVKGDQEQIKKYIEDCLAVKAKYPKGF